MELIKEVYTVKEVCGLFGLHMNTVYGLIRSGKLEHRRLGRKIVIDKSVIQEFGKVGINEEIEG